jgi:hypothetical protein
MKLMKDYAHEAFEASKGQVEIITPMELRAHPGECLTQVSLGKTFCIKRKGKIVAFLVPPCDYLEAVLNSPGAPNIDIHSDGRVTTYEDPCALGHE